MSGIDVTYDKKEGTLTIVAKVEKPFKESSSGKNKNVVSTGGFQRTDVKVEGKDLRINLNAIIAND